MHRCSTTTVRVRERREVCFLGCLVIGAPGVSMYSRVRMLPFFIFLQTLFIIARDRIYR